MTTPSDDDQYIAIETEDSDKGADEFSQVTDKRSLYEENQALKESLSKSDRNFYILLVSLILAILAFVVTISIFAKIPKTQYIATSDNTAICNVLPQDNPNYTNESITTFAQKAVVSLYTFNFLDADDRLASNLSEYYTSNGKESVSKALTAADLVGSIKRGAKSMRGYATTAPVVTEAGDGFWKVQFDFTIEVYGAAQEAEEVRQRRMFVTVVPVTRNADNSSGLGVESIQTTGIN